MLTVGVGEILVGVADGEGVGDGVLEGLDKFSAIRMDETSIASKNIESKTILLRLSRICMHMHFVKAAINNIYLLNKRVMGVACVLKF